ncbi:hypothetical protein BOO71_0000313 [Deinococcus marmoris]|uniref:Uncharacterized protein n=1 Tax=Deinococcus marmoris TaxID=249408 RepID=A0A1U7P537_9DEIO|nr:hypothetical protein BOO71_0000313 [Deinococcus marmoris]
MGRWVRAEPPCFAGSRLCTWRSAYRLGVPAVGRALPTPRPAGRRDFCEIRNVCGSGADEEQADEEQATSHLTHGAGPAHRLAA